MRKEKEQLFNGNGLLTRNIPYSPRKRTAVQKPRAEQGQVGWALGNMIWWLATLPVSRGLEFDDPCGSFQSRLSYESVDMSMYQCWDLGTSSSVKHTL